MIIEDLRANHIDRLQNGACTVNNGISFIEVLNNTERISDHCSNIAVYIIQKHKVNEKFDRHTYLKAVHQGSVPGYTELYNAFYQEFVVPLQNN